MRPLLLDTNAYTALMLGDAETLKMLAHAERVWMNSVVLGELLGGFAAGTREATNRELLAMFLDSQRVELVAVTATTADSHALIYSNLRRKGQPIPSNDLWVAASALEHGAALLIRDAHFSQIEGLRIGRRLQDFLARPQAIHQQPQPGHPFACSAAIARQSQTKAWQRANR